MPTAMKSTKDTTDAPSNGRGKTSSPASNKKATPQVKKARDVVSLEPAVSSTNFTTTPTKTTATRPTKTKNKINIKPRNHCRALTITIPPLNNSSLGISISNFHTPPNPIQWFVVEVSSTSPVINKVCIGDVLVSVNGHRVSGLLGSQVMEKFGEMKTRTHESVVKVLRADPELLGKITTSIIAQRQLDEDGLENGVIHHDDGHVSQHGNDKDSHENNGNGDLQLLQSNKNKHENQHENEQPQPPPKKRMKYEYSYPSSIKKLPSPLNNLKKLSTPTPSYIMDTPTSSSSNNYYAKNKHRNAEQPIASSSILLSQSQVLEKIATYLQSLPSHSPKGCISLRNIPTTCQCMTYMKQQLCNNNNNNNNNNDDDNNSSSFPLLLEAIARAMLKFHELDHWEKRQYIIERLRFCDLMKRSKDYDCLEEPERVFVLPVDYEFLEREYLVRQKEMAAEEEEEEMEEEELVDRDDHEEEEEEQEDGEDEEEEEDDGDEDSSDEEEDVNEADEEMEVSESQVENEEHDEVNSHGADANQDGIEHNNHNDLVNTDNEDSNNKHKKILDLEKQISEAFKYRICLHAWCTLHNISSAQYNNYRQYLNGKVSTRHGNYEKNKEVYQDLHTKLHKLAERYKDDRYENEGIVYLPYDFSRRRWWEYWCYGRGWKVTKTCAATNSYAKMGKWETREGYYKTMAEATKNGGKVAKSVIGWTSFDEFWNQTFCYVKKDAAT